MYVIFTYIYHKNQPTFAYMGPMGNEQNPKIPDPFMV